MKRNPSVVAHRSAWNFSFLALPNILKNNYINNNNNFIEE